MNNSALGYFLLEEANLIIICLAAGLLAALLYRLAGLKGKALHLLGLSLFICLLGIIFNITGLPTPDTFHFEILGNINLIPLVEGRAGLFQYTANVIMFLPVGFLLPLLWQQFNRPLYTVAAGFLFSLFIELLQLFTYRATDIDDLLMNTLGALLGFLVFCLFRRLFPRFSGRFQISWAFYHLAGFEYLFCFLAAFLLHISLVPILYQLLFHWIYG